MNDNSITECASCGGKLRIIDTWAKKNYVKRKRRCEDCESILHTIETHENNVPDIYDPYDSRQSR